MIVLDTDHLNVLQIGKGATYDVLVARMDASFDQHFVTTVITFEEHMRGWLASIRRARFVSDEIRPYGQLVNLIRFFQAWEILCLDDGAVEKFRAFRNQGIRVGTLELKIASITLASGATLLSANTRDFSQVPFFASR